MLGKGASDRLVAFSEPLRVNPGRSPRDRPAEGPFLFPPFPSSRDFRRFHSAASVIFWLINSLIPFLIRRGLAFRFPELRGF